MADTLALSFENLCVSTKQHKTPKALLYNVNGYVEKGGITAGMHTLISDISRHSFSIELFC